MITQLMQSSGVILPRSEQWDMHPAASNRPYRIFAAWPSEAPPPSGYPVIYVLDGNAIFGTMVDTVRAQSRASKKTGVSPAVVIGIGYATEAIFDPARIYDFTLPTPVEELPAHPLGQTWPQTGGAESFLTFIQNELKPLIERKFAIDSNRQTIFGHSLGGLFALQTLFLEPDAFQFYIAGSPSIHWNKKFIHEAGSLFAFRAKCEPLQAHVLLAAGELERGHHSRMNERAEELADRLSVLAPFGIHIEYKEFEQEGHISVLPVLASRAVRFALS